MELQDPEGKALPGFSLSDCDEIFGDTIARTVSWNGVADVSAYSGKPVRLSFDLKDADVYAMQFLP